MQQKRFGQIKEMSNGAQEQIKEILKNYASEMSQYLEEDATKVKKKESKKLQAYS